MKIFRLATTVSLSVALAAALFGQDPPPAPQGDQAPQPGETAPPAQPLNPNQLQDLVAPIALYPDTLLSQILVATTYPIEVVEAQQWLQQNRNLHGQQLMDAARQQNWDPSVQALVAFPDVLGRLNQDIRWTTDLGNAFLAQQPDVMSAVQQLRARAQANGKLQSTPQETVTTQNENGQTAIDIAPPDPEVVYVPVYNPAWVWGPPVYGYYPPLLYPGLDVGFSFFPGIDLGLYFGGGWGLWGGFGWGWGPDWFGGRILLNGNFFHRYGFNDFHGGLGGVWAHDPGHRMGVPYPNRAVASRFGGAAGFRGTAGFRGNEGFRAAEGSRGVEAGRAEGGRAEIGRAQSGFSSRPAESGHSAFGGIQNGGVTRMQSDHGFASMPRSGGFGGGGFGGGGGFHGGGGGGFHGGGGGRR
ncbi:MAG TPA: DUF3300 domain-containing protein [Bryobacteraceae bacterium]|nr:DUF3300 domain-containing protein [Bryobacteraceae bacterium]